LFSKHVYPNQRNRIFFRKESIDRAKSLDPTRHNERTPTVPVLCTVPYIVPGTLAACEKLEASSFSALMTLFPCQSTRSKTSQKPVLVADARKEEFLDTSYPFILYLS